MKSAFYKIALLFILTFSLSSCAQNTKTDTSKETVSLISPTDLNAALGDIQLVDVRTPQEFAEGHLKNAVNVNYFDNSFLNEMSKLDKNKELYIYCKSGNRSGKAARKLKELGFTKVYDLRGGISNWNSNNLEVIK